VSVNKAISETAFGQAARACAPLRGQSSGSSRRHPPPERPLRACLPFQLVENGSTAGNRALIWALLPAADLCHFFPPLISYVKASGARRVYPSKSREANHTLQLIVTWGPLDHRIGSLPPRLMSMTHHDFPFVVSLIWLTALSGGLIFLLAG
jgi:hypothetical protein